MSTATSSSDAAAAGGIPRVLISAYAASPAHGAWDPALEEELFERLMGLPAVAGLEVPWVGALHPHDSEWFVRHVPRLAVLAVTALPWVMRRCAQAPGYGLASADPDGQAAALADLRAIRDQTADLAERSGVRTAFVMLHSAPRGSGSADAFARSLGELATWDWVGARLAVEHCDAVRPGQPFEKGFLSIDDELAVLDRMPGAAGLWMNWGRSAIELRDPAAVTRQIALAAGTGRLTGLTFSGASVIDDAYGPAWIDTHPPIRETDSATSSLLTAEAVAAAVRAAGDVPWWGVKVSRRTSDRTAADVAATVGRNLAVVRDAIAESGR
ncbi:DUF4862 family protein [Microbacterium aureliae]